MKWPLLATMGIVLSLTVAPAASFASLGIACDGNHDHLPWGASRRGRFHTADEAEFPDLLCPRMAALAWASRPSTLPQNPATPTPILRTEIPSAAKSENAEPPTTYTRFPY